MADKDDYPVIHIEGYRPCRRVPEYRMCTGCLYDNITPDDIPAIQHAVVPKCMLHGEYTSYGHREATCDTDPEKTPDIFIDASDEAWEQYVLNRTKHRVAGETNNDD